MGQPLHLPTLLAGCLCYLSNGLRLCPDILDHTAFVNLRPTDLKLGFDQNHRLSGWRQ
jgi:hypothetical protein